ncbi:hypothetical protein CTI12_AA466330 [Artemisia annua]|uniref:Reverse transcriptase zinc-binding domain-containing protein n=1 Tax=Artemisia annua TaxID=35608 RepID=A0A2U1LR74_ARTAN|nr:hypothetical protein CTI12_AA466330 [Artemisia annua]
MFEVLGPQNWSLKCGDVKLISFWNDTWIGSLISWNLDFSMPLSPYESHEAESLLLIMRNAKLDISANDSIVWNRSQLANFRCIMWFFNANLAASWAELIWNNIVPFKIQIFHWLAIQGCIPVKLMLGQRVVVPSGQEINCVWCFEEVESVDHLILQCSCS